MANDVRVRAPGVGGVLSAILTTGATSMSSAKLANLPVIDATNHAIVTFYDENGQYETVRVTAHTASATTATIAALSGVRPGAGWPTSTKWRHGPVADDFLTLAADTAARTAMVGYQGMRVLQVDTADEYVWVGVAWRKVYQAGVAIASSLVTGLDASIASLNASISSLTGSISTLNAHAAATSVHGVSGSVVGTSGGQTLQSKTLESATLTGATTVNNGLNFQESFIGVSSGVLGYIRVLVGGTPVNIPYYLP